MYLVAKILNSKIHKESSNAREHYIILLLYTFVLNLICMIHTCSSQLCLFTLFSHEIATDEIEAAVKWARVMG